MSTAATTIWVLEHFPERPAVQLSQTVNQCAQRRVPLEAANLAAVMVPFVSLASLVLAAWRFQG